MSGCICGAIYFVKILEKQEFYIFADNFILDKIPVFYPPTPIPLGIGKMSKIGKISDQPKTGCGLSIHMFWKYLFVIKHLQLVM